MIHPSPISLLVAAPAETIRRQERVLGPLNLALLAGVATVHLLFSGALGSPPAIFFAVLLSRFVVQVLELVWLQGSSASARALEAYAHVPIWLNLACAFTLSRLGGMVDSHYVVLMLLPVLAAAFRYRPAGIVLVVVAAGTGTALQIWLFFRQGIVSDPAEYFEAANVALIYATVALVAALIARELRRDRVEVEQHLATLEATRDELLRKERLAAVGRLASAVAHEIRNPVTLISTSLALARRGGDAALPRADLDAIVEHEIARLEKLTTDFLAYARQRPPDRQPTALTPLLEVVASLARARAAEAGVELRVSAPGDFAADLDAYLLQQALLNLVGNALDVTPRGGHVEIGGCPRPPRDGSVTGGAGVEIWVANDGPAIAATAVQQIFEPFFSTKQGGSGLGLAISRAIAEAHGGELILAENRDGAVHFVLVLPPAPSPGATSPAKEASWPAS
jgi:signal transduction histidine kinase